MLCALIFYDARSKKFLRIDNFTFYCLVCLIIFLLSPLQGLDPSGYHTSMTQAEALDLLKLGHNVFLTGAAGTGKTFLLNDYIKYLKDHGVGVAITASTGIAATHIGGQTIHSWSGMGIRDALADDELIKLTENSRVKRNFKNTNVLIIDEISMLHAHQLNMVDQIARRMKDFTKPFGGLQVILSGDFFQLPPVSRGYDEIQFAYECPAWEHGEFQICYLHEQYRQGEDPLLDVLNDIRNGEPNEETRVPLRTRYKREPRAPGGETLKPTKLYAKNINVDTINAQALKELDGDVETFLMQSRGFKQLTDGLKKSCLAPEELNLKLGAEVMFVKNSPEGDYVNGTRGTIIGWDAEEEWPIVRTFDGEEIVAYPEEWRYEEHGTVRAAISQVPLRLAWAITIHKSQGMTLDAAEVDLSDAFEPGMGYVALSRVRTLNGLKLMGLNDTALMVHPKVLVNDRSFRDWSEQAAQIIAQFGDEEKKKFQEDVLVNKLDGLVDTAQVKAKKEKKKKEKEKKEKKIPTHFITKEFLEKGMSLDEIANERDMKVGTLLGHLEKLQGMGELPNIDHLKPPRDDFNAIMEEFAQSEDGKLTPIHENLGGKYDFDTLKLVRLFVE